MKPRLNLVTDFWLYDNAHELRRVDALRARRTTPWLVAVLVIVIVVAILL